MMCELWIVESVEGTGRGLVYLLFRKLSGETVENPEGSHHSRCSDRPMNPGLPEYGES